MHMQHGQQGSQEERRGASCTCNTGQQGSQEERKTTMPRIWSHLCGNGGVEAIVSYTRPRVSWAAMKYLQRAIRRLSLQAIMAILCGPRLCRLPWYLPWPVSVGCHDVSTWARCLGYHGIVSWARVVPPPPFP